MTPVDSGKVGDNDSTCNMFIGLLVLEKWSKMFMHKSVFYCLSVEHCISVSAPRGVLFSIIIDKN